MHHLINSLEGRETYVNPLVYVASMVLREESCTSDLCMSGCYGVERGDEVTICTA